MSRYLKVFCQELIEEKNVSSDGTIPDGTMKKEEILQ